MSASRLWAVVAAAGKSERMGEAVAKQYQRLAGRCVLDWSVQALLSVKGIAGVMIAHPPGDAQWQTALRDQSPLVNGCAGGATRAQSVRSALTALQAQGAESQDWVLVHDAARPAVCRADIEQLIAGVGNHPDGGLLAVPVRDTLKRSDANACVEATVSRAHLWQALTPQYFPLGRLAQALAQSNAEQLTDEASAMEQIGARPRLVTGRADNTKLTTSADIAWLAFTLGNQAAAEDG